MSTDASSTRFGRLNSSNYPQWEIRMEAILVQKKLFTGIVEITINPVDSAGEEKTEAVMLSELRSTLAARDVEKMAQARAEIILRVEDSQLAHMQSRDPAEIWVALQRIHRATGFSTSLALRRAFLGATKRDDETIEAWVSRVSSLALRLAHAGIAVTVQDHILTLTSGLPPSYEKAVINFDSVGAHLLTLDFVVARLLNEEFRQSGGVSTSESSPVVLHAAAARASRPLAEITCYFCDKKGHFKDDCPERIMWQESKKGASHTAAFALMPRSAEEQEADEEIVACF